MIRIILLLVTLLLFFPSPVKSIYDPLSVPNNKFGIHIIDENDLISASHLVNSSGGDWGYVTIFISQTDRKLAKWIQTFNQMKSLSLIPVIRLATILEGDTWSKPSLEEMDNWVQFLDSLPWYTQNRYLVIYNEPNHAKEWGGRIDPQSYTDILIQLSEKLKEKSSDFYILPAGLDASAKNTSFTMDEAYFLSQMYNYRPDFVNYIDGWTSHSYPNPDFNGRVTDRGRGTLSNYLWEKKFLQYLGITKNLPVFITETGWRHNQNNINDSVNVSPDKFADYILLAGQTVWNDENIVMISPFLLNYQSYPFASFSWQKLNSDKFYPQYDAYRSILKINGQPKLVINSQETKGIFIEKPQNRENYLFDFWPSLKLVLINISNKL